MHLSQLVSRFCQIANITPLENEQGKIEYMDMYELAFKKGAISTEQFNTIKNVLGKEIA